MTELPIPRHIHREDDRITITWDDTHEGVYPARTLRLWCQCASCKDELTGAPLLHPASVPIDVKPLTISLVGAYAIKIDWSDGHSSGIYPYEYLLRICPCDRCRHASR